MPWWAAVGLVLLSLAAVAGIVLNTLALFKLTERVSRAETEICALYVRVHLPPPRQCPPP